MPAAAAPRWQAWRAAVTMGDVAGGLTGAITSVPGNIAIGFVALAPLGIDAQSKGVGVALLAAAIGGGAFTLASRTRGLMAGGSMSFALLVASVLATLVHRGVLHTGLAAFPSALAVVALLTLLTGLCEAGLAASGLGQLVTLLPYPVVSGIRNGVALLTILLQLRPMLGLAGSFGSLEWVSPAAALVGVTGLVLTLRPFAAVRLLPPALFAVLAASGVHYLLAATLPPAAGPLGPLLAVPGGGLQHLHALADGWAALPGLVAWPSVVTLVPAALTIAVVSSMESLVGASVMQDISGEHGSSGADLFALAAANLACGLCGTTPVTGGSPASMAVWGAGGRGKSAGWIRAAVLLAVVLLAGPAIGLLPIAALAGMVVGNAVGVLDAEVLRLGRAILAPGAARRAELAGNLVIMAAVTATAMVFGLVAAVSAGLLLCVLIFVAAASSRGVRRRYRNPGSRSRTVRSEAETEILLRHGQEIEIVELHGVMFFGSADRLVREVEATWEAGAGCVILDFKRVSQIDLSAARRLLQMAARYWSRDAFLALAELRPGSPVLDSLASFGLQQRLRADRVFPTLGEALACAERVVLTAHGALPSARLDAAQVLHRLGFTGGDAACLLADAPQAAFAAGEAIIRAGEQAHAVFILVAGEVEVSLPLGDGAARARLATLTAGTLFGEMALLSGGRRSADVTALTPARCLRLDAETVARFRASAPELAYRLMAAIAGQLASNLAMANAAVRSAEE